MALTGAVRKGLAALVGVGFVGGGLAAFRVGKSRGFEGDAQREVQSELSTFAADMARCAVSKGELPETTSWVPARLADVAQKTYVSTREDWDGVTFACAGFHLKTPQTMQYRWRKLSPQTGVVEARGDLDGDGAPDRWFEVEVNCRLNRQCQAANYVTEVTRDGIREPPSILRWLGRSQRYLGEPPSLTADDSVAAPVAVDAPPKPLAAVSPGAPTALNTIYFEAERRAAIKLPGAVLLELELQGVRERLGNTAQGFSLHGIYGTPDGKGFVELGQQVVSVTFNQQDFVEKVQPAARQLHAIGFAECLPEKLVLALEPPGPLHLTLSWNTKRERALWLIRQGAEAPKSYGVDSCAFVK